MSKRINVLTNVSDALLGTILRAFRLDGATAVIPKLADDGTWTVQAEFNDEEQNPPTARQPQAH